MEHFIEIVRDEDPVDPRKEYDNVSTLLCFHKLYSLGDDNPFDSSRYNSWEEFSRAIKALYNPVVMYPVYMYDHSGLALSLTPFSCPWDSGQVGFVFVSRTALEQESPVPIRNRGPLPKRAKDWADATLKSEFQDYAAYVAGESCGFEITDEEGEIVDSCYGFYSEREAMENATETLQTLRSEDTNIEVAV